METHRRRYNSACGYPCSGFSPMTKRRWAWAAASGRRATVASATAGTGGWVARGAFDRHWRL